MNTTSVSDLYAKIRSDNKNKYNFSQLNESLQADATLQVNLKFGYKEGKGTVISSLGIITAVLYFENDKLHGCCLFLNKLGERHMKITFVNGIAEGWFCEYSNNKISKMGFYKNGNEFSVLRKNTKYEGYLDEYRSYGLFSRCKYTPDYKKDGLCTFFSSRDQQESVVRFEKGVEKEKKFEFETNNYSFNILGKMTEYDEHGNVVYAGEYEGDVINGIKYKGSGQYFSYRNNELSRIDYIESGNMKKYQLFDEAMEEYDQNGELKYEGECKLVGTRVIREGYGVEYASEVIVYGEYKNNERVRIVCKVKQDLLIEYENKKVDYVGEYVFSDDFNRVGKGFSFVHYPNYTEVYACENGEKCWLCKRYDRNEMTEYNKKREVIYRGSFKVNEDELTIREGLGYEFENGVLVYYGDWKENKRNGNGKSYRNNMIYYTGLWSDNKPNGVGELMEEFEVKYEGEWKDGIITLKDGQSFNYNSQYV